MTTLNQLRSGAARAWDTISQGWRELVERAGDALTRFHPSHSGTDLETHSESVVRRSPRWGILAAEITLNDDTVEVNLEVPGMDKDGFEIHVADDMLVVQGEKKVERESSHGEYFVMERAYGRFERTIQLPAPVDEAGTRATYKRGVLRVTLPRSENATVRRIQVTGR